MANLPKKKVFDTEGNEVLPITHVSAVYDDNGTSVGTLFINMDEKIDNKIIEGYYIDGDFYTTPPITHDYVEIDGVKWATVNLGAESETDYGLYFLWGDTQGYTLEQCGSGEGQRFFDWSNYKYCDGTDQVITKYNSTDNKTVLDTEDDAATAMWGSGWRMPTTDEYVALGESTTYAYTSDYNNAGIVGLILTDNTDSSKKLFFPAAGSCCDDGPYYLEENGFYMSSSVALGNKNILGMSFLSLPSYEFQIRSNRSYAHSIRAIYDGPIPTVIVPILGALYIDKSTNVIYRYDGSAYVQLSAAPVSNSYIEAMWSGYDPLASE